MAQREAKQDMEVLMANTHRATPRSHRKTASSCTSALTPTVSNTATSLPPPPLAPLIPPPNAPSSPLNPSSTHSAIARPSAVETGHEIKVSRPTATRTTGYISPGSGSPASFRLFKVASVINVLRDVRVTETHYIDWFSLNRIREFMLL